MRGMLLSGVARSAFVAVLSGVAGGVLVSGAALAADLAVKAPPATYVPAWSWAGFYAGTHSAAYAGSTKFDDPFGPSIFGDRVTTPAYGWGGQIGYNWQAGNLVYGLETDATWLGSGHGGTNTCGAFSSGYSSPNCGAKPDGMGTVTARVGTALGPEGHTLAYAKGGFAWQNNDLSATNNNNFFFAPVTNSTSLTQTGWTVGAGVEQALTPAWSVKFEYDYMNFGHHGNVTLPASSFGPVTFNPFTFIAVPAAASGVSSDAHVVKLGANYHFGEDPWSTFGAPAPKYYGKAPASAWAPGWEFEGGGRYWYSSGRFQKDLPAGSTNDKFLVSRLTYEDTANAGEFYGRVDTPVNVFVKGYVGGGGISGGHMNDEDWGLFGGGFPVPVNYSNTLSSVSGSLPWYGTIDLGYNLLRSDWYKVGAFVGYSHYKYNLSANGCTQIANPNSDCVPSIPTSVTGITESDTWNSLRVGVAAETQLFDRWKIGGDVAYIPYTKFTGTDDHLLRSLVFNESGHGQGVQADVFVKYMVTDAWSVGVGGRYWALWTTSGSDAVAGVDSGRNDTYRAERVGITLQTSYKFDVKNRTASNQPYFKEPQTGLRLRSFIFEQDQQERRPPVSCGSTAALARI